MIDSSTYNMTMIILLHRIDLKLTVHNRGKLLVLGSVVMMSI